MQALDCRLWRWRGASRCSIAWCWRPGFLRADVSGGGRGAGLLPLRQLLPGARLRRSTGCALQYRQGLRTFDNRRGLTSATTPALGPEDGSTHNFALVARYRGLQATGLAYFLNLEKADEVDDDLLRLTVAYEF